MMPIDCPSCGGKTKVYGTLNYSVVVHRYCRCKKCNHQFKTEEVCPANNSVQARAKK